MLLTIEYLLFSLQKIKIKNNEFKRNILNNDFIRVVRVFCANPLRTVDFTLTTLFNFN